MSDKISVLTYEDSRAPEGDISRFVAASDYAHPLTDEYVVKGYGPTKEAAIRDLVTKMRYYLSIPVEGSESREWVEI